MPKRIRSLIIHRNRLFREGLAFALTQKADINVVGVVAHPSEILQDIEKLRPDAVILDLCLPDRDGLGQARLIRRACSEVKILMIGLTELESDVIACVEAGAAGYLPQEASLDHLLQSIRAVAAGEAVCSPKVAALLFSRVAEAAGERELRRMLSNLTRREVEIIALIEERLSNKEIAAHLQIEVQTVKNHIHNILGKLQLDGRREVARYAREWGLLPTIH
ncbi:MAG: response regulator [Planctomycetota bacterium]|jgi:DNA-binding NarL/FixJ family response regulator